MIPIQYILLENATMSSHTCYCTVSIKQEDVDDQLARQIVQCQNCETLFHLKCINMKLAQADYYCLECKISSKFLNNE